MPESMLSNRVLGTLTQIKEAIKQLQEWNKNLMWSRITYQNYSKL